jgi:hypothetical protein
VSKVTPLATGLINGADMITIALVSPADMPATIRIIWPDHPTVVQPARYNEVASTVMRMLATASAELARIKASRRL